MSARTRKDWILWSALGCALAGTAHAEYTLAVAAHFNEWVALAVPGALDLYVIRALQQRRDVFVAVLAMVAANVAAHLVVAGVLPVEWPVVSAVGAVAPLIVWRVYSLKYESGAVSAPALGDEVPGHDHYDGCGCRWWRLWSKCTAPDPSAPAPAAPEYAPGTKWGALAPAPAWVPGFHLDGCDGQHALKGPGACLDRASALSSTAPDHVPADWMEAEYPETHPSAPAPAAPEWDDEHFLPPSAPHSRASAVPYLAPVPDLPPEYEAGAVHSETSEPILRDSDWKYLPGAQEYVDKYHSPSVKGLRRAFSESGNGIGQERAERLLAHLGVRP